MSHSIADKQTYYEWLIRAVMHDYDLTTTAAAEQMINYISNVELSQYLSTYIEECL